MVGLKVYSAAFGLASVVWLGLPFALLASDTDAACTDVTRKKVTGYSTVEPTEEPSNAKQRAIRDAIFAAHEQADGVSIARQAQTSTESSSTSVQTKRRERVVVRSSGRILGWEILSSGSRVGVGSDEELYVELEVEICVSPDSMLPMIISIEAPDFLKEAGMLPRMSDRVAEEISSTVGTAPIEVSREAPDKAYNDIAISFSRERTLTKVDNRSAADLLTRLVGGSTLSETALEYQLLEIRATVLAKRFIDLATISETTTRKRRLFEGDDLSSVESELLEEAIMMSTQELALRLARGELAY